MVLIEMQRIFEKRRTDLIELLENNSSLDASKQHQIYGAILEIEIFLRTLEHFRKKELNEKVEFELRR
jgi:hypothetical protein